MIHEVRIGSNGNGGIRRRNWSIRPRFQGRHVARIATDCSRSLDANDVCARPAPSLGLRRFHTGERLFAYLDDVYVVTTPDRVCEVLAMWRHSRIRIRGGKTQVWNAAGIRPPAGDALDRVAQSEDPQAPSVWRGRDLPPALQGIGVLDTPLGHDEFVEAHLARTSQSHETLLEWIAMLSDVQSAWAFLLHCANARATYLLRVVTPEVVQRFTEGHDHGLWRCLSTMWVFTLSSAILQPPMPRRTFWLWVGFAQCSPHSRVSFLGQLGGFTRHDTRDAS